jgi:hypothetical protein
MSRSVGDGLQPRHRGVQGDGLAHGLAEAVVERQPAPLGVQVDDARLGFDLARAQRVGDVEDDLLGRLGDAVLVGPRLVGLQHRELGRVRAVDALVAEDASHLVDPVDAADHGPLEVELQRDPQRHVDVERVQVGGERTRRRTAVDQLQRRRLDLQEAQPVQRLADRAGDRAPRAHHRAGLVAHDQVGVPLPDPSLLRQVLVQRGQRAQRLRRQRPAGRHDRQLAPLGRDDPAGDRHDSRPGRHRPSSGPGILGPPRRGSASPAGDRRRRRA